MFRLLFICSIVLLLYFGFTLMQSFDSKVFISLYNYDIETTFVFSIIAFLLLLVSCIIIVRFLILIIDLPIKIQNIFYNKKINNNRHSLVSAFAKYITGDKAKAGSIARKNLPAEDLENEQEFYNLILAETEEDIDAKIAYFQNLAKSKEFTFYSNKNLAKLYYDKSLYQEAENYAIKAYNLNEYDLDNLITLLHCYGELSLWTKFTFIANKLAKLYKKKAIANSSDIASYYLLAAKKEVDSNNISNALDYLES
ncbi:MAG: heme biosynthesis HemY N-terminal domain-containing protein, partial [Rickettsia endosymbiont of Pentastiridius leporinus]